ncbi:MAG TPA: hypothetical protein VI231_22295 [Candidatus Binatia bacterium]|jgi:hypothetical protein
MTTYRAADGEYPKLIVVAAGPSECGKTRAMEELFLHDAPRRISIDFVGEVVQKYNDDALELFSIDELRDALVECAKHDRWHIALCIPPESMPDAAPRLARLLNPARTSSDHHSFPREVGGVAIDCSEARLFVPNMKSTWAAHSVSFVERGRHNRLSMFFATQAPQSVERRVTDAADHLLAFRTQEEAVWNYWRSVTSSSVADTIAALPKYHCAWIVKDEQAVYLLDAEREVYRVLDYAGHDMAPASPIPTEEVAP